MTEANYRERLKDEYRTLVVAFFNAVEKNKEDRELSAGLLFDKAKQHQLTDKESMTADWLRHRVYSPDKYKQLPRWLGQAAFYCLLDLDGWQPSKPTEWFAMIALFILTQEDKATDYDTLKTRLPEQLDSESGFQWLKVCLAQM